jgi:hypothetical protein
MEPSPESLNESTSKQPDEPDLMQRAVWALEKIASGMVPPASEPVDEIAQPTLFDLITNLAAHGVHMQIGKTERDDPYIRVLPFGGMTGQMYTGDFSHTIPKMYKDMYEKLTKGGEQ